MRVCLIVVEADHWRAMRPDGGSAPVSGMGEVVRLNARVLSDAGHDVVVALPPTPSLQAALKPFTSTIVDLHPSTRRSLFGRNVLPVRRILKNHRPDVLHFHVPHYRWALDALMTAHRARGAKVVRTEHNPMMIPPEQPYRSLLRVADAAVDRFVYVSVGNRERWEGFAPWRAPGDVVVNVVDPERLSAQSPSAPVDAALETRRGLPPESRVAMFVAGAWDLDAADSRRPLGPVLQAMAALPPFWHLFVAGTGDLDRAAAMADGLGVGSRVHLLGPAPDAARLTASCDVLVSASHFEGLSVAYLEAWYAGVPVLCTEVDGIEDVVGDGSGQITVPHGDVAALTERWRQVGDPSTPFMQASQTAFENVRESFLVPRFATDMLKVYEDLAAR